MTNKYYSNATVAQFEKAAKIRKYKFEQQRKASATQCYMTLAFGAVVMLGIAYNVIIGLLG